MGGHRKRLLEPHRALVIARMTATPDVTLKALVAELADHGIATSMASVWRLVRSEGLRFKKMYDPPCPCKGRLVLTVRVCTNVSGLSRVDRCCGQALMRSARVVPE